MCDDRTAINEESVRDRLKTIRALLQAARERISTLRPAWSVYLISENLARLDTAIGQLENDIGLTVTGREGIAVPSAPPEETHRH